jgi:hypothetical protein
MNAPPASNADMLEFLRFCMVDGQPPNFRLCPAGTHPSVPEGDTVLLEVIDLNGQGVFFTNSGVALPNHGFTSYRRITSVGYRWPDKLQTDAYVDLVLRDAPKVRINLGKATEVVPLVLWLKAMKDKYAA